MTSATQTALLSPPWRSHEVALALRLLAGCGAAAILSYHDDPPIALNAVAHGLTRGGEIAIAAAGDAALLQPNPGEASTSDVRFDIVKEAPDFEVRILAASAHMLGTLTWLTRVEIDAALAAGNLPLRVAEMARVPGARVATLVTDRILLHDAAGVRPWAAPVVLRAGDDSRRPAPLDALAELMVIESVSMRPGDVWGQLHEAVVHGELPGVVLARRPTQGPCGHVRGRTFCVDIDSTGVVLMKVGAVETTTAFLELPAGVDGPQDISAAMQHLCSRAHALR